MFRTLAYNRGHLRHALTLRRTLQRGANIFLDVSPYIHYSRRMALNIKDPEADRLVRELVAVTGESITEAARKAFAERLQRVRSRNVLTADRARVRDIIEQGRRLRTDQVRSEDDILGYDENGLPES